MKCNYCNKKKEFEEEANNSLITKQLKNEVSSILEIDKDKLVLWVDNLTYYDKPDWFSKSDCITSKKINYCPMCGRKLNNLGDDDCE